MPKCDFNKVVTFCYCALFNCENKEGKIVDFNKLKLNSKTVA